jgi:hypothetical protein
LGQVMGGNGQPQSEPTPAQPTVTDIAQLLPQLVTLVERTLEVNKLKKQTVGQVLEQLEARAAEADKPVVVQAREALKLLPILADMNFEDVYLRYVAK